MRLFYSFLNYWSVKRKYIGYCIACFGLYTTHKIMCVMNY